jgi:hypothetical protein
LSCSGEEFTSASGGGAGSSSGGASSGGGNPGGGGTGGALPGVCPGSIPSPGSACDDNGRLCTYGDDARPNCRTHVECVGSKWATVRVPPAASCGLAVSCELATVTGTACFIKGDECTSANRYCACLCVPGCGSYKWKCSDPVAGCPAIAPNAGTGCSPDGRTCMYGACDDPSGVTDQVRVDCKNGVWEWTDTSCLSD